MCTRLHNGILATYLGSGDTLVNAGDKWWVDDDYLRRASEDLKRADLENSWLNWYEVPIGGLSEN